MQMSKTPSARFRRYGNNESQNSNHSPPEMSLVPDLCAARPLFPDENRVTRTIISFARRLKIRQQGHKFRRRRWQRRRRRRRWRRQQAKPSGAERCCAVPCRVERDDNFTTKCTTRPGGTFTPRFESSHSPVRNPPPSSARFSLSFPAPSSCPSPPPPSPLRAFFSLHSFFLSFFLSMPGAYMRVYVSLRRCLRGAMPPSQRPRDFSIHFLRRYRHRSFTCTPI